MGEVLSTKFSEEGFMVHPAWFSVLKKRIWDKKSGGYRESEQHDHLAALILGYLIKASENGKAVKDGVRVTYKELMQLFKARKSTIRSAINNLVYRGLVNRTFHTVELDGIVVSNVMFLKPNIDRIERMITTE